MTDGTKNAFIYANGQMLNLGALYGDSEARAINNLNQVVGTTGNEAFFWSAESGMVDLNSLLISQSGVLPELAESVGINEYGQIICLSPWLPGVNPSVALKNTYLLTPASAVPLPSAIWLLSSGVLATIAVKKCRRTGEKMKPSGSSSS
jgi:probable HAF family extracellular repeat protein